MIGFDTGIDGVDTVDIEFLRGPPPIGVFIVCVSVPLRVGVALCVSMEFCIGVEVRCRGPGVVEVLETPMGCREGVTCADVNAGREIGTEKSAVC